MYDMQHSLCHPKKSMALLRVEGQWGVKQGTVELFTATRKVPPTLPCPTLAHVCVPVKGVAF